ncbi:MAG: hypothetical protein Q9227_005641 [Pyrenula ochraceoflavens]
MDMEIDNVPTQQRGDPEAEREMARLWRTVRTVHEMLADRGYVVSDEELTRSLDDFRRLYSDFSGYPDRSKLKFAVKPSHEMNLLHTPLPTKANPEPQTTAGDCYVEFNPDSTIGIKHLRAFAQTLDSQHVTNGIMITQAPVTAAALRAFEPLSARGITAEHFLESDLLVNITRHELVPKHVLLSAEEKKILLERYRLREHQLPRIQANDPVARYLGLKRTNVMVLLIQARGRGGGNRHEGGPSRRAERAPKQQIDPHNPLFEKYYTELNIVPEKEQDAFWAAFRRDLPNSFRFTGSRGHALAVQERLKNFYIPEITSIRHEGEFVEAPKPVAWYPDQLAWYMTVPKQVIRRFPPFASFQKFLVAETDVGNISRQEVVSMIPPLVLDVKPGMTVLDLCASPGSKSAQLIEMVHAGEEERMKQIAENGSDTATTTRGPEWEDDGRSTGLLIANDVDYRRSHMLVHQVKRLSSPNVIVTNHDATMFPSIKLPSEMGVHGNMITNKYLKFDRVLADVPCTGDGTARKNSDIWRAWTPQNAIGLHTIQVRILIRALQVLKVGGRVVYSTCSMNPVEDEAVVASAISRCGGRSKVCIVDSSSALPGLIRYPGLSKWKVMDRLGRLWQNFGEVEHQRQNLGPEGLGRLSEGMFPPLNTEEGVELQRCMRIYPHSQDTGAFFIAVLEKKSEIRTVRQDNEIRKVETSEESMRKLEPLSYEPGRLVEKTEDTTEEQVIVNDRIDAQSVKETEPMPKLHSLASTDPGLDEASLSVEAAAALSKTSELSDTATNGAATIDANSFSNLGKSTLPVSGVKRKIADIDGSTSPTKRTKRSSSPHSSTLADASSLPNQYERKAPEDGALQSPINASALCTESGSALQNDAARVPPIDHQNLNFLVQDNKDGASNDRNYSFNDVKQKNKQPFEEPFKYLDPNIAELDAIRRFYKVSTRFPQDRFMVRNATGIPTRNIYYTTSLAKAILQENEGKGLKFVHSGVKMFVKQDVPRPEVCPWRIQNDGIRIIEAWVGTARVVTIHKRKTLRKLLVEMFPGLDDKDWPELEEIRAQIESIPFGCCVLRVEPDGTEDGLK